MSEPICINAYIVNFNLEMADNKAISFLLLIMKNSIGIKIKKMSKGSEIMELTVFMPVFNGEDYIEDTIRSILNQSYEDFEFLIIDDGSTDSSISKIEKFKDNRIRIIKNHENKGLPYTRNLGLELSKGNFIAFMDSDDLAHKDRLKIQLDFLREQQHIDIVSCRVKNISKEYTYLDAQKNMDKDKVEKDIKYFPALNEHPNIAISLLFTCILNNPGTMIRASKIKKAGVRYREKFIVAQDYSFWVDCQHKNLRFFIINENLIFYRSGHSNITTSSKKNKPKYRSELVDSIRIRALENNGFLLEPDQLELFCNINKEDNHAKYDEKTILQYKDLLKKLVEINYNKGHFAHKSFKYMIQIFWCNFIVINADLSKRDKFYFLMNDSFDKSDKSIEYNLKMLSKKEDI